MFKHPPLPNDGSPLSKATIQKGVEFAKRIDFRQAGLYVMPKFSVYR
ncbi:MAG: hypothetical protein ACREXT_00460 [Gammaproteobacteria bacterium]